MSFTSPMQLAWIAAIAIVVLLYLRWGLRKQHETATLALWRQALAQRPLWTRWRRIASMLAACVPIVLMALALAQPILKPEVNAARTFVVVIDATASMNATDVRPSRLAAAKTAARQMIYWLRTHERMAILSADSAVHARCGLTDDRSALVVALDEIQATDGAGAMPDAIATAQRLLAGRTGGVLVVISDGRFEGADALASSTGAVLQQVGTPAANVAITKIAARPLPGGTDAHEVFVEVANYGAAETDAEIVVATGVSRVAAEGGELMQARRLHLRASATANTTIPIKITAPALLTAKLTAADALAADNVAQLLVVPPNQTPVLLISTQEDSPTSDALASIPGLAWKRAAALPSEVSPQTILVFEGPTPERLPLRPALVIGPMAASDLWQFAGNIDSPQVVSQADHPLLANIDLTTVLFDRAAKLKFNAADVQSLAATAAGEPIFARVPRAAGDVLVLAAAPGDGDLALRGDFPRLVAQSIAWLGRSDAAARRDWTTRDVLAIPAGESSKQLVSPFGATIEATAGQSLAASLNQVGVWQVSVPVAASDVANPQAVVPANLLDPSESDIQSPAKTPSRVPSPLWPDFGPLWSWLVGFALVWVVGMWVLFQRGILQ